MTEGGTTGQYWVRGVIVLVIVMFSCSVAADDDLDGVTMRMVTDEEELSDDVRREVDLEAPVQLDQPDEAMGAPGDMHDEVTEELIEDSGDLQDEITDDEETLTDELIDDEGDLIDESGDLRDELLDDDGDLIIEDGLLDSGDEEESEELLDTDL